MPLILLMIFGLFGSTAHANDAFNGDELRAFNARSLAIQPTTPPTARQAPRQQHLGGLVEEFREQNQVREVRINPNGAPSYFLTNPQPTYGGRDRDNQQRIPSWRLWQR